MNEQRYEYTVTLISCPDCGVLPGYEHSDGCDVARCPQCGTQMLQCFEHEDDTTPAVWTGIWPGEIECAEYGLWSKWVDGHRWAKSDATDPQRHPDLNTLSIMAARGELIWSIPLQRYVKPYAG